VIARGDRADHIYGLPTNGQVAPQGRELKRLLGGAHTGLYVCDIVQ
jgi:hypothetical protein